MNTRMLPGAMAGWLMAKRSGVALVLLGLVVWPMAIRAQTSEAPDPKPPPGEEVMRPTKHGLRLTPAMVTALMRVVAVDSSLSRELDMTAEQERRFSEAAARRIMTVGHRDGREAQAALEYLFETFAASTDKPGLLIKDYREFADKAQPLVKSFRDISDGILEDARQILNAEQFEKFSTEFEGGRRSIDRFERRLQNYREGRVQEGENPFDELEVEDQTPGRPRTDPRVRNAQRMAQWEIIRATKWEWDLFLTAVVGTFKFDEAQRAKGRIILAEYLKKAEAIQTSEWQRRVKRNRTLVQLQWQMGEMPKGPWLHRLEKEYQDDMRPIYELGDEFRKAVLSLATPEQRANVVNDTQAVLGKLGLQMDDAQIKLLQGLIQ